MKVKIFNPLIIINLISILLILVVTAFPSNIVRFVLGIPFLLFIPGYSLISAMFVDKGHKDVLERFALSVGVSIAIVAFTGFALNYTVWGIRTEPVLYCVTGFTLVMSLIALVRRVRQMQAKLIIEFNTGLPVWRGSIFSKSFSIILLVSIIGAGMLLGRNLAETKTQEPFTEFYMLGLDGKAQDYPTSFFTEDGQITRVRYNIEGGELAGNWGKITLVILNHEQSTIDYSIKVTIDDLPVKFNYNGSLVDQISGIELLNGEQWEQEIGFAPDHIGDKQNVKFLLYKNGIINPVNYLNLWINNQ